MEYFAVISVVVNFAVLMVGLVMLSKKPVKEMLNEKHDAWKKNIEEAEALREETQKMFDDYQQKLSVLDKEVEKIISAAKAKGEQFKANMEKRAHKNAEKIVAQAKALAEQELEKAKKSLQNDVLAQALTQAEKTLKEKVTQDDQDFFVEGFVQEMERSNHGRQ
ncbi:MAG TPA: ATP synthase F0 subunit B [Oligoflexia bacterium]|nr:ATP synthase F0 subunit B [Oligoflexia bacterium]HMR24347.1 ATP synthase F0 subunit B [Oligoflexia bacterium]